MIRSSRRDRKAKANVQSTKTRFHRLGMAAFLRVVRKFINSDKASEHETNRGEVEKSERVSGEIFEILGQPAAD